MLYEVQAFKGHKGIIGDQPSRNTSTLINGDDLPKDGSQPIYQTFCNNLVQNRTQANRQKIFQSFRVIHLWYEYNCCIINITRHCSSKEEKFYSINYLNFKGLPVPLIKPGWKSINSKGFQRANLEQGITNLLVYELLAQHIIHITGYFLLEKAKQLAKVEATVSGKQLLEVR